MLDCMIPAYFYAIFCAFNRFCLVCILEVGQKVRRWLSIHPFIYLHQTAASVRTHCSCWSIPRPLTCSMSSHQSSACGLASPTWSTKTNLASNDWARPPAAQSRPHLGVEACAGPFQVAKTRGDGYVLPRTRQPMMMMNMAHITQRN